MNNQGPFPGDVRLLYPERDKDKPFYEILDFEVFDGNEWIKPQDARDIILQNWVD